MSIFSKLFGSRKFEIREEDVTDIQFDNPPVGESPSVFDKAKSKETIVPQDIPDAIRFIVESQGKSFLDTRGMINVLNDFKLLKDNLAAKNVLQGMLDGGYIKTMLNAKNWQLEAPAIKNKFVNEFGTRQDLVSFIVDSFGYGLRFISIKPDFEINQQSVMPPVQSIEKNEEAPIIEIKSEPEKVIIGPYDPKRDLINYRYPSLDLLDEQPIYMDIQQGLKQKNKIVDILRNFFNFQVVSIKLTQGAAFDFFELEPAQGMSFSTLKDKDDELTMYLSPKGVNVIAPIPGTNKVGIVVPKDNPVRLTLELIINSRKYQESTMALPCAIGQALAGGIFMFDLATLPHLLIGGASGQGKSICLHTILLSLLFRKHPAEVKLVLIDYKKIELGAYRTLEKHFLAVHVDYEDNPIISSDEQTTKTFAALKVELDARYDLIANSGTRNIQDYNKKFCNRMLNPDKGHKYMPYIIIAIDEYSEISAQAIKTVEPILLEIAKKGRTAGIHLIISTNRPTADIISSAIKSELTGRIAFRVNTTTDSRLIINYGGAEKLIGYGDMYFSARNVGVQRVQCALPSFEDIERVCEYIQNQQGYLFPFELDDYVPEPLPPVDLTHLDPMFEEAARLIVKSQSGSTSLIQRKFVFGYNRAGRLMDQLQAAGIVGPAHGSKPRDVLIQDEYSLERILRKISVQTK